MAGAGMSGAGALEAVVIDTPRLRLRMLQARDIAGFVRLADDPRVYATTLRLPSPYRVEDARAYMEMQRAGLAAGNHLLLAIALKEHDEAIGSIGLTIDRGNNRAEIGFWIGTPYWNRGLMTEAAGAMVGYGFARLGLRRIWGGHFAGNEASGRVQRKIGMKPEGVLRQCLCKNGTYYDDVVHAVLREEFVPCVAWSARAAGEAIDKREGV